MYIPAPQGRQNLKLCRRFAACLVPEIDPRAGALGYRSYAASRLCGSQIASVILECQGQNDNRLNKPIRWLCAVHTGSGTFCLGLTNSAMRSYALRYLTFLQAKAQGLKQEEPKNGRASSFDCVLIRSYLTKLYRDMIQEETDRAA